LTLFDRTLLCGLAGSDERKQSISKAPFGAVASDAAAEAGLSALIALLNVSVQPSGQVLLNLLDRLVRVIALPRTESCEEVRLTAVSEQLIQCFQDYRGLTGSQYIAH
jgi:hypothetical protein